MLWTSLLYCLLFILRLKFRPGTSISVYIRRKYGLLTLKLFRTVEKLDLKQRKLHCDIDFLKCCSDHGLFPKFLTFKLYNNRHYGSRQYFEFQRHLLNDELQHKQRTLRQAKTKFDSSVHRLKSNVSWIDFVHLLSLSNNVNEKSM